jgi:hypothetical protein
LRFLQVLKLFKVLSDSVEIERVRERGGGVKMRRESEIRERQAESGDEGKERKRRTDRERKKEGRERDKT